MKKKVLLRTLVPLATASVGLGMVLPITSCSCNVNQPIDGNVLLIDSASFRTYLTGTYPDVDGYTQDFTDYLNNNTVDKIVFDIDNISIGNNVFSNYAPLNNISKPIAIEFTATTITSIGEHAFQNCASISQIICSSASTPTINDIGDSAFFECTNLTGFSRGSAPLSAISILSIGNAAFYGSADLDVTQINSSIILLPSGYIWTAGNDANSGYWLKTGITLYASGCLAVGSINCPFASISNNYSFYGCASLTEITNLPGGNIGSSTFYDCADLTTVKFASGTAVGSIGGSAFYRCRTLNSIQLSTGWTAGSTFGIRSFLDCPNDNGVISGTNAQDLLDAIHNFDSNYLKNWIAIEQP